MSHIKLHKIWRFFMAILLALLCEMIYSIVFWVLSVAVALKFIRLLIENFCANFEVVIIRRFHEFLKLVG